MEIVWLDQLHGGFYGGEGQKSIHAIVFQKAQETPPLDSLMYFEDLMTGGIFRRYEQHTGNVKEEDEKYVVDGEVCFCVCVRVCVGCVCVWCVCV